ncbi:putative uncharacterized acetyltransferase [Iris pallida]|uniref:Uncharacterized acetyltransferase n=1 Tax=Iris pallida TaxID=29817 RepID=A0AAX6G600_IRIPA|nr:putative uncharacterized acetyltransferase [Iris pallida]
MDHLELTLGALLVIVVSALWGALVNLLWKPYAMARRFKEQGVRGPEPKFWSGSLEEIKSLKKDARGTEMDVSSHDIVPRVLPSSYTMFWRRETFSIGSGHKRGSASLTQSMPNKFYQQIWFLHQDEPKSVRFGHPGQGIGCNSRLGVG